MEVAEKEKVPVTEVLFRWQFKKVRGVYKPTFREDHEPLELYHYGLKKLQEVSADFSFTSPRVLHDMIHLPMSEEKRAHLEKMRKNKAPVGVM